MSDSTGIEWTDATWNPVVGCSVVSPGCTNCYAMRMAARIEAMQAGALDAVEARRRSPYAGLTRPAKAGAVWTGKVALAADETLTAPLRWKKPRKVFVNSMGDLFHEAVPDAWIDRVFAVMALAPQHTFQVLTKRAGRMRAYLTTIDEEPVHATVKRIVAAWPGQQNAPFDITFPLPNVWLGVSAEDQGRANDRIPDLLATPAAVRFVSHEPSLGPVRLDRIELVARVEGSPRAGVHLNALAGRYFESGMPYIGEWDVDGPCPEGRTPIRLDWVIAGGESGSGARPMHPDWARDLRDQCEAAGVPFFFKQWGEWAPGEIAGPNDRPIEAARWFGNRWNIDRVGRAREDDHIDDEPDMFRVGKRRAGRGLDGVEHNAFPGADS